MVAFVLSLISAVVLFISYEFGFVLGVVSIIVAIVNKSKKSKLTIPAIVISGIVLILSVICFSKDAINVKNVIDETNKGVNEITEKSDNN